KPLTACVNASHRVGCVKGPIPGFSHPVSTAAQFMDPDLSSMMKMSLGIELLSDTCVAHASPPRPPVMVLPVMVLPVTVPPVCEPPVMMPASVLPPVWVRPPVCVPEPPVRLPLPEFWNTEESPLLPQPPDIPQMTPAASVQSIVAFPYFMVTPP